MFSRVFAIFSRYGVMLFFASIILSPLSVEADEYRAFWLDGWYNGFHSQSQVDALLGKVGDPNSKGTIREANCNAVIVQVRRRFDVAYPSGVGEPFMSGLSPANFNALAAIIKAAHDTTGGKKRVEVHCWSVVFKTAKGAVYSQHNDPNDPENYWPTRVGSTTGAENPDGAFDPGHPKALEYLVNAHMDLVNFQTTAGPDGTDGRIDGIHYDYIRFEGNNEGFNPTSVARYNARYGLTGEPSSTSEQFKQWRRDQVTAFVRQMYARIQKANPQVKQTGAFITWNPSPTASTRAAFMNTRPYYDVYSDWDSWMEEGIIDVSIPMTYYRQHQHPDDYVRWMNFQKDRKFNRQVVIGPGIYLNSLENAILHLNMTREPSPAGNYAQGFAGYSYRVPYASGTWSGFRSSLVSDVTPNWADIPEMPWKITSTRGHLMGEVTHTGTGDWADHAIVSITGPVNRSMHVDGTGFYAFIDLPPGNYTVTANKPGYINSQKSVEIAIGEVTGNMYERDFALNLVADLPSIQFQPQDALVYEGGTVSFAVSATGGQPLHYQWRAGGENLFGANAPTLTLSTVTTNHSGNYDVVITNSHGAITSSLAALTVIVPTPNQRIVPLWSLKAGDRPYLTTDSRQRGLAYNTNSNRLLLVSRVGSAQVYALDATSGLDLHVLNQGEGIIQGGYADFTLQMIGAANDGAVYAGNLTLDSATTDFKIYRWSNDNPETIPTLAYAGNPIPGTTQRWGDTLDVRGSGTNTQIIAGSRTGTVAALFTTSDGTNFTATPITVSGVGGGSFGLGIAFGEGNTFWGKANGLIPLRQIDFNGTVLRTHGNPDFPNTVAPIGVSVALNLLGGIAIDTPDHFRLYDLGTNGDSPALIETNSFATDFDNANGVGSVDFGKDMVFALDCNNGIIALRIQPPPIPNPVQIEAINLLPDQQVRLQMSGDPGTYLIEATTDFTNWLQLISVTNTNGIFEYIDSETNSLLRFYRAKPAP